MQQNSCVGGRYCVLRAKNMMMDKELSVELKRMRKKRCLSGVEEFSTAQLYLGQRVCSSARQCMHPGEMFLQVET